VKGGRTQLLLDEAAHEHRAKRLTFRDERKALRARLASLSKESRAAERRTICPGCGCHALGPRCAIYLGSDGRSGVAACVPRGVHGRKRCSACEPGVLREAPADVAGGSVIDIVAEDPASVARVLGLRS
jgi:hypothetical protein